MRYEIRAMSFGEILDTGFQLLRNHFQLLVGLSLVLYAPVALLTLIATSIAAPGGSAGLGLAIFAGAPLGLAILVVAPIVSVAVTYAIGHLYLGEPVSFSGALGTALSLTLPVVGTSLLSTVVVAIGFAAFIVPGIYAMLAFLLLFQVMVMENVFGIAAMRRSHELMKGNKARALGVLIVGGILVAVLSTGLQLVLSFLPVLGSISTAFAQAIGNVYTTAISVVLYFDIRCRKEAFDLERLAQLVQGKVGGTASASPAAPPLS